MYKKIVGGYTIPGLKKLNTREEVFNRIYETKFWTNNGRYDSVSGKGSTPYGSKVYTDKLSNYFNTRHGLSIFDAPCGDFSWMYDLIRNRNVTYIGGDICSSLIEKLRRTYNDYHFMKFDICTDSFPIVDLWHCRHCFFHLSFRDIISALHNFANSRISYALITTHFLPNTSIVDIDTGGFRPIDLRLEPICLPEPMLWLEDFDMFVEGYDVPMCSGLWSRNDIISALKKSIDIEAITGLVIK
ncbi:MAG: hypothetical protein AB2606_07305 [Candidatus Thiodiazotropha taylori]